MTTGELVKHRCCTVCKNALPETQFYCTTLKATGRVQYQSTCKPCYKLRINKYEESRKKRNNGVSRSVSSRIKNPASYAAHIINSAKTRSKKKNREFSIDVEWFLSVLENQDWKCAISGIEMVSSAGTKKRLFNGISIDRIDNKKGYTPDNCWLVCYSINAFKADSDLQQIINLCQSVAKKWEC